MALEPIEHAIELIQAGKKAAARAQLLGILEADPEHEEAWLWLAACAATREEHSRALREVLRINPDNRQARKLVLRLARRAVFERSGRDYVAEKSLSRELPRRRLLLFALVVIASAASLLAALTAFGVDLVPERVMLPEPTLTAAEVCTRQLAELRRAMVARCSGLEKGQACLMNGGVAFARQGEGGDFTLPGDRIRLENLVGLRAQNYEGGQVWGLAALNAQTDDPLRFLLVGGAELRDFDPTLSQFSFSSTPNDAVCDSVAPSGLLVQSIQQVRLVINKARLDLIGSAFIESEGGGYATFSLLEGVAELTIGGELARLSSGQAVQVPVDEGGDPAGIMLRPPEPPLTSAEQNALGELAQMVGFETPWIMSDEVVESVPDGAAAEAESGDLAVLAPEVIVFSSERFGSADLFMVDTAGRLKRLTNDPAQERQPALSPDGRFVVYSSDHNGSSDIYLLDLSDETIRQLTLNAGNNRYPSWADDRIVFTSDRDGTPQIWMMGLDGSSPQKLTSAAGGVGQGRRVGRDGALAYGLAEGGIVIDANGDITVLEDNKAFAPSWSPDGTCLAYHSTREGGIHVYLYDVATQQVKRLTDQSLSGEAEPIWSPDGSQIAFVSRRLDQPDLFIAEVDSGSVRHLASGVESPHWGRLSLEVTTPALLPSGVWVSIPAAVTSTLYDVRFLSPEYGLAVGENNVVLRYQAGVWGRMDLANVQAAFNGERLTFYSVEVISEREAWAVGERGAIIHLSDGVWRVVKSPTEAALYAVRGGWAVGAGGTILWLGDDGWQPYESPTQNTLTALYFRNEGDGWAVGESGTVLRWNGEAWQVQLNSPADDLYAAALPSLTQSWLAGEGGLYRRNRDGWLAVQPANMPLLDMQLLGDGSGWAVGKHGVILYGKGDQWAALPKLTYQHLNALSFSSPDEGWAVGQGGTLLHYTMNAPLEVPVPSAAEIDFGDPVLALATTWDCAVLQGANFYHYELTIEQLTSEGSLVASGLLPEYGYTVVALEGRFGGDVALLSSEAWSAVPNYLSGIAWAELRETEVLMDGTLGAYAPNGILRLYLTRQGQLKGAAFGVTDDSEERLAAEVRQCVEEK